MTNFTGYLPWKGGQGPTSYEEKRQLPQGGQGQAKAWFSSRVYGGLQPGLLWAGHGIDESRSAQGMKSLHTPQWM
jgi:hypothetical protein